MQSSPYPSERGQGEETTGREGWLLSHGFVAAATARVAAAGVVAAAVGIAVGVLHIALVVGGDVLHHLSVAVIAGDLYGHAAELVLLYPRHTVVRIGVIRHDEAVCRKNNPGFG